jgi:hypothetical protein
MIPSRFAVVSITILLCLPVAAQMHPASQSQHPTPDVSDGFTGGYLNGRAWQQLGGEAGAGLYIKGCIDGAIFNGECQSSRSSNCFYGKRRVRHATYSMPKRRA